MKTLTKAELIEVVDYKQEEIFRLGERVRRKEQAIERLNRQLRMIEAGAKRTNKELLDRLEETFNRLAKMRSLMEPHINALTEVLDAPDHLEYDFLFNIESALHEKVA